MSDWEILVNFQQQMVPLKADLEYHGAQVMRIRVHGSKRSLLLETNYPIHRAAGGKAPIKWQIREGKMDAGTVNTAHLFKEIISALEKELKKEFP